MTTHLSDLELQTWADDESDDTARADAWRTHIADCAACRARVAAIRSIGDGVRAWADDLGGFDAGLADRILGSTDAMAADVTAPETAPNPTNAIGATTPTPAGSAAARATGAKTADPAGARVVPLRTRRWIWGAAPIAVAAAAALVFALVRPIRPHGPIAVVRHGTAPDAAQNVPHETPFPTPLEDLAANVDPGSEVISVEGENPHSSYSVLEIHTKKAGTPVAVVWIDDRDEPSGTVQ